MLGFAWILRNEAAEYLERWIDTHETFTRYKSVDVHNLAFSAIRCAVGISQWYTEEEAEEGLDLLTAHNAEPRDEVNTHGR